MVKCRRLQTLSVVAPFFNEEAGAAAFCDSVRAVLDKLGVSSELVLVDDGSTDATPQLLAEQAAGDDRVTVLSLARNFGHQAALTAGLDHARGDAVITMDADLQHPPELIPRLVEEYERGAEVVYAVREGAAGGNLFKRLTTRLFYWLIERTAEVRMIPGAADFRLMSQRCVRELRAMREPHRYLRGLVPWLGLPYATVSYQEPRRARGEASYTLGKSLRLAKHGLFSFSTAPLQMVTWLGVALTAFGMIYFAYILVIAALGRTVVGWASVIVSVLVIGGVQLISLGVLAQYIGMLFEQGKGRPLYVLKQERASEAAKPEQEC